MAEIFEFKIKKIFKKEITEDELEFLESLSCRVPRSPNDFIRKFVNPEKMKAMMNDCRDMLDMIPEFSRYFYYSCSYSPDMLANPYLLVVYSVWTNESYVNKYAIKLDVKKRWVEKKMVRW